MKTPERKTERKAKKGNPEKVKKQDERMNSGTEEGDREKKYI